MTTIEPVLDAVERLLGLSCGGVRSEAIVEVVRDAMATAGFDDPGRYARRLERDAVERDRLAEALRVPETYFLRDAEQLQVITELILPTLVPDDERRLRMWSAGCASGEEAYSLAITLEAAGLAGRADILATDRSALALQTAVAGRYRAWSLRALNDNDRLRYFATSAEEDEISVASRLRSGITFERHDLTLDPYRAGFDLIVCRNVLLYLTPERGREVVERFAGALAPGGWLVLGAADPHHTAATVLEQVRTPAGALYRRRSTAVRPEERAASSGATRPRRHRSHRRCPTASSDTREAPVPDLEVDGRSTDAVGGLTWTVDACEAALQRRPLEPELHVLHARSLLEAGRPAAAMQSAKRARFLAPDAAAAHLVLGSAYLSLQDAARSAAAFERAGQLLESLPPGSADVAASRLLEVARAGARRSAERSRP